MYRFMNYALWIGVPQIYFWKKFTPYNLKLISKSIFDIPEICFGLNNYSVAMRLYIFLIFSVFGRLIVGQRRADEWPPEAVARWWRSSKRFFLGSAGYAKDVESFVGPGAEGGRIVEKPLGLGTCHQHHTYQASKHNSSMNLQKIKK